MLIDWFTVIAQVVNFLILVWLLKRFLYQPILNAIDAREQRVAAELADADAKRAEASTERDAYRLKNEDLDRQRATLLNQAQEEAKAERLRLLDAARQEADQLSAKRQQALRSEQQSLAEEFSRRTREEVFAIARKTLAELAGATLEQQMLEIFLKRLRELESAAVAELKAALKPAAAPLLLRSAYPLGTQQRSAIEAALKEILGTEQALQYDTVPELLSGIELSSGGHKLAWSISGYLGSLERHVDELLKMHAKPPAQPGHNAHE